MLHKSSSNPDLTLTLTLTPSIPSSSPSSSPQSSPAQTPAQDSPFGSGSGSDPISRGREKRLPLFLARGLGIDRIGSGLLDPIEGVKWRSPVQIGNGEEARVRVERALRRIVDDEPQNAAALRDYAQFLCQVKGDAKRAEEYYSRAILIEPLDGEILSEYAKLVWDLHADVDRALTYFEKAILASPQNYNVFAAYAAFMWEIEETEDASANQNFFELNFFPAEKQAPTV